MRLQVVFKVERVPLLYRNAFMSFLKEVLQATPSGERRFHALFFYGHRKNKAPKPFCFAVRFAHDRERFAQEQEWLYLTSPLFLYFSVFEAGLLVDFYNGLLQETVYPFCKGEFVLPRPVRILPLREKKILKDEVRFRTLAPVLIEDDSQKPLLPDEDPQAFLRELNYYADAMLLGVRGKGLAQELGFEPLKIRKEVVKHAIREGERESRVYTFTCFSGEFLLRGDPQDLYDIQVLGLGRRRAQGFGMLEVVGSG
ncbi:MAG: CRISPR-associated endoribonuclease Cas6 [Atribacterota bacterium]